MVMKLIFLFISKFDLLVIIFSSLIGGLLGPYIVKKFFYKDKDKHKE